MSFMSFVASDYGPGYLEDELYSDEDFGYGGNSRHKEDLCFDERPYASDEFLNLNIQEQKAAVASLFREKYPSEELQEAPINAVVGLLKHDDTFLLSGASFAQSRVPELFFHMIEKKHKPVVLVLNSIDTVGDQMVLEKQAVGITAVNLTWRTMNKDTLKKLKDNQYSFIYISPDVFLNNEDFAGLYDSNKFSRHLVLKVVNEAYWIYLWNLKKTEQSKNFSVHVTPEDVEKFRTTYRYNLAKSLNEISTVPLLLMSESCRPQAVVVIMGAMDPAISYQLAGKAGRDGHSSSLHVASEWFMPSILSEIERERSAGMPVCRCSNCDPKGAALLLRLLPYTNAADLESLMSSNFTKPQDNPLASQEEQENEESEDEESEESEDEESEDEESEDEESEDERSDNESPKDKKRAARQKELGCIPLNFDYRDGLSFGNRL
ncbi:uncharacterized protein MELLADRAFT_89519 [Melampsora larici-populina 98AG31]|uniref:DNA 3'-5' helicase n=1 Tax=Melampsora larici-populina (strain 98AG31 / pathotype 3-4-7) TaxID=747676 RepID=F4RTN1_MELLP|nr:uncharacterized protein MELLADRAFT_89519 [Melampsora larici-populina 98AG31]EGG04310.1 hypothetical protein MELLADRAFT_89519 [Melampsora larici-populina 98AG31]